ncbi:MAG: hypothetical protein AAF628_11180 [Planctomycetota bacterium]
MKSPPPPVLPNEWLSLPRTSQRDMVNVPLLSTPAPVTTARASRTVKSRTSAVGQKIDPMA